MVKSQPIKVLCYGIGNMSRGDDALGPLLMAWLKKQNTAHPLHELTFEEVFQLQPENIYDFSNHDVILFLDADARIKEGICFESTEALSTHNVFVSHALSPEKLLSLFQDLKNATPPRSYTLSMGANDMSLQEGLSAVSQQNLDQAKQLLSRLMDSPLEMWDDLKIAI